VRFATWNLRGGAGQSVWPRLRADVVFLQEATAAPNAIWSSVPGGRWGSSIATTLNVIRPLAVPGYQGWVIGCEADSPVGPMALWSVHAPTSTPAFPRRPYSEEVISILGLIRDAVPAEVPLVIGGDFNFTLGERHPSESLKTNATERRALAAIAKLGMVSCWSAAHPDRPLPQTLRWSRDTATTYHCDGILVPQAWAAGVACEVLLDEPYMVSDHNPISASVNLTASPSMRSVGF